MSNQTKKSQIIHLYGLSSYSALMYICSIVLLSLTCLTITPTFAVEEDLTSPSSEESYVEAGIVTQKTGQSLPLPNVIQPPQPAQKKTTIGQTPETRPVIADLGNGKILKLPQLNQPVIDTTGMLSSSDKQQISQKLFNLHQTGLVQVGVVIVPTTQPEDIFSYSLRVAKAWQLGTEKTDNGLLIVVAMQDRKVQILTGYGVEGVIPDVVASRIIYEQMTPAFKQGQYAQGISNAIDEIATRVTADPDSQASAKKSLQERQDAMNKETRKTQYLMFTVLGLLIASMILRPIFGRFLSSIGLSAVGTGVGLFMGIGFGSAIFLGLLSFIFLMIGVGNLLRFGISVGSGGGGSSGYSGGGGSFGGGGASGSW